MSLQLSPRGRVLRSRRRQSKGSSHPNPPGPVPRGGHSLGHRGDAQAPGPRMRTDSRVSKVPTQRLAGRLSPEGCPPSDESQQSPLQNGPGAGLGPRRPEEATR